MKNGFFIPPGPLASKHPEHVSFVPPGLFPTGPARRAKGGPTKPAGEGGQKTDNGLQIIPFGGPLFALWGHGPGPPELPKSGGAGRRAHPPELLCALRILKGSRRPKDGGALPFQNFPGNGGACRVSCPVSFFRRFPHWIGLRLPPKVIFSIQGGFHPSPTFGGVFPSNTDW